jgi:hypothetical protein
MVAVVALSAAWAADVAADHCGAQMDITPAAGQGGTTFLIKPNLGANTVLMLSRNGRRVLTVQLPDPALRYQFHSRSGDAGAWTAEAAVQGQSACGSEGEFSITGLPSTATAIADEAPPTSPAIPIPLLAAAAIVGGILGWNRRRPSLEPRRPPPS